MFKRASFFVAVVALMWASAPSADAVPIVGGLSISGSLIPVNASGAETPSYLTATGLDFTTESHVASPGVAGTMNVENTSGDFNILAGTSGTIKDFMFAAPAIAGFPVVPISNFELGSSGFAFDLLTINRLDNLADLLTLRGTGLFHLPGLDPTLGTFVFSGNQFGETFSFSASEGAVPEPGSMMLLGTGLICLAGVARRRWLANA